MNLKRENEARTVLAETTDTAEKFVAQNAEASAWRAGIEAYIARADILRAFDPAGARKAFARASEWAELLPDNNRVDLLKRVIIDEGLGDLDNAADRLDDAGGWYAKEYEALRKKYALQPDADNLESMRISISHYCRVLVKTKKDQQAMSSGAP